MAKQFGQRPASFVFNGDLSGDLIAYQFDRAVYLFGTRAENRWKETDEKGRPVRTLEQAMEAEGPTNLADLDMSAEDKIALLRMMLG